MTAASGALLQTKLFAPRVTRELVDRPRLTELLGDQLGGEAWPPVLLVSAPAGFGKSTLLAQAAARRVRAGPGRQWRGCPWTPVTATRRRFWAYVLAALRTALPSVGGSAQVLLESPGGTPITTVLTTLLNDLASLR